MENIQNGETLAAYGFPEGLLSEADLSGDKRPARVTAVFKGRWQLMTEEGLRYAALKTKEYLFDGGEAVPTVGDYVLALPAPGDWQIVRTLRRKSFFSRMDSWHGTEQAVAANIDVVFAVQSLNENFSQRRLERYLTLGYQSGARPVVLLTKTDLPGDHGEKIALAQKTAGSAPVLAVSARTGEGIKALEAYLLPGVTAAFLGSSGVGKSSLVNRLMGESVMAVNGIRERDDMGRHTTTHRQMLLLPGGALVIDTPGMRELGMWDASEGLSEAFPDVERFLGQCRFSDCRHQGEPGCAIRSALESGELSPERWKSYRLLQRESRRSGVRRKQGQPSKALGKQKRQEKRELRKKFPEPY